MSITQVLLLAMGMMGFMVLGYMAFAGPSTAKASARRLESVRFRHSESVNDKVQAQLKKAAAARKSRSYRLAGSESRLAALELRLIRTGKNWNTQEYLLGSGGLALTIALLLFLKSGSILLGLGIGLVLGLGLPHFVVGYLINKRAANFTNKFPDAIELLVRGLRSGLPVSETLNVITTEIPGPVGDEFKLVSERIKIGKTMDDALQDSADRINMPEFNFFCITLAIQRETGGNLAETLANLADVLRKRAQMKLKVKAMSSESKASAYIVGALPFVVFIMIYTINPTYLAGFFTETRLIIVGLGGLVWMAIGAFVMAKMVNFEI